MSFAHYIAPNGATPLTKQKSYVPYNRSLVCGVGINNSATPVVVNGEIIKSYDTWRGMLRRCYSVSRQKIQPTYAGCYVAEEWLRFSNFEKWYAENYIEGHQLDKDLLVPGNKMYGPKTCMFVPQAVNTLLLDCRAARGECPLGVCFNKTNRNYRARIRSEAFLRNLGSFDTPLKAHQAWQLAKADIIANFPTTDPRIRAALDKRAAQLRDDHAHGRITLKL